MVTVAKDCDATPPPRTMFRRGGGGAVRAEPAVTSPPGKTARANSPIFGSSRPLLSPFSSAGRSQSENLGSVFSAAAMRSRHLAKQRLGGGGAGPEGGTTDRNAAKRNLSNLDIGDRR